MDLIEGRTLRKAIEEGLLAEPRALRLASQVLEVLEKAHEPGIVRRDLKPENLLLTKGRKGDEEVRVLDFGIAKAVSSAWTTGGLTLTGTTVGTVGYMSPEQAEDVMITTADRLRAQGKREGKREGFREGARKGERKGERKGLREGKREGFRGALVTVLRARFGEVGADAARRIGEADARTLERWIARAARAAALAEVLGG